MLDWILVGVVFGVLFVVWYHSHHMTNARERLHESPLYTYTYADGDSIMHVRSRYMGQYEYKIVRDGDVLVTARLYASPRLLAEKLETRGICLDYQDIGFVVDSKEYMCARVAFCHTPT